MKPIHFFRSHRQAKTIMKLHMHSFSIFTHLGAAALLATLSACGGGGGGDSVINPPGTSQVELETFSGFIRASSQAGAVALQGVTVSIESSQGTLASLTDANGTFIIPSIGLLPVGTVHVTVDGSTAIATGPLAFPKLELLVPLQSGTTDLVLPQIIVLPDLNNDASANQSLPLIAGAAQEPIDVQQPSGLSDISLKGPADTILTSSSLTGAEMGIDLNITPVALEEVPMPLPNGWTAGDFVTIQPGNVRFDPPGQSAVGLDIVLPNSLGLPVGTEVDIWSFDHDEGEWVNRSVQTGHYGKVVPNGTLAFGGPTTHIEAFDVITEGGWHAAGITVDVLCATTFTGQVVDESGAGILGASIALSTGQFATTDSNGSFTTDLVPAYDTALFEATGDCEAIAIGINVVLPPSFGGLESGTIVISDVDIMMNGVTVIPEFSFTTPTIGSLAGVVIGDFSAGQAVTLTPTSGTPIDVIPNAGGAFFASGLDVGPGVASFLFTGESVPTEAIYEIFAGQIATVSLQFTAGTGNEQITVLVLWDHDDNEYSDMLPLNGAQVRLQGTDPTSTNGLIGVTDITGRVLFQDVTGPFNVTAQKDEFVDGLNFRVASSVIDITPVNDTIGILFFDSSDGNTPILDATVSGHISNLQGIPGSTVMIRAREAGVDAQGFDEFGFMDGNGNYSINVPSGLQIDVSFERFDFNANSLISATIIKPAAGQAPSGGNLSVDADFSNSVRWDHAVAVTLNNLQSGFEADLDFRLSDEAGTEFHFGISNQVTGTAVTVNLPDLSDPRLLGFEGSLAAFGHPQGNPSESQQDCEKFLVSTPSSITLTLLKFPGFISPAANSSVLASNLVNMNISFDENSAGETARGFNFVALGSEGGATPAGIDVVIWGIFLPDGVSNFKVPPTALPMIVPSSNMFFEVSKFRTEGFVIDYAEFFSENLQAQFDENATTRTLECETYTETLLTVQ